MEPTINPRVCSGFDTRCLLCAKASGTYAGKGRPASIDAVRIREMKAQGLGACATSPRRSASAGRASIGCWKPFYELMTRRKPQHVARAFARASSVEWMGD
jgi:hypothetical protein